MSDHSAELAFAMHLADIADRVSMDHFRGNPAIRAKPDGSLVTEADERVEHELRRELRETFPSHGILGEEEGSTSGGGSGPRWIIDPIDGTNNYAWGIPVWATLIALEDDGEIVVGVVSAPALGERYDAARGSGARRNAEPLHVSDVRDVNAARVGHASLRWFEEHGRMDQLMTLVGSARASRGLGDFWGHMLVAAGALDIMVEAAPVKVWDLAALIVIVEEAGGRLTDLSGVRRVDGGSCLTSNGHLHEAGLAMFRR